MALQVKMGVFQVDEAGTLAITGVGFQPKAVIFFSSFRNDGAYWDFKFGLGAAVSATQRWFVSTAEEDFFTTTRTNKLLRMDRALEWYSETEELLGSGDFVSMDADGFTLDFLSASFFPVINYIALGGIDLSGVYAGSFDMATGTGTQAVTGVGFRPDLVLMTTSGFTSGPVQFQQGGSLGFGMMTPVDQWALAVAMDDLQANANTARGQRTDRCLVRVTSAPAFSLEVERSSFDDDGFTINKITGPDFITKIPFLCLKGVKCKLGAFNAAVSGVSVPTNIGVAGVGFRPKVEMVASYFNAASASAQTHAFMGFGAVTGLTDGGAVGAYSADAVAVSEANTAMTYSGDMASFFFNQSNNGETLTTWQYGRFKTFDPDGFTNEWTNTIDTNTRQFLYCVLGDGPKRVGLSRF